jgi:hypothetical protein
MFFPILILLLLLSPLSQAKEIQLRANIVQQCATTWKTSEAGYEQPVTELDIDCLHKIAWAKIHTMGEQQWQRVFIDY